MNISRLIRCFVAASAILVAQSASATEEQFFVVAQPIVTENGICIGEMTYTTYSMKTYGDVVDFTCRENYVLGDYEKPTNRNAASLAGIKAKTDGFHTQEEKLYGDTLRVEIDLSVMDVSKVRFDAEDVVDATLECVLINATRSMGGDGLAPAKHLRVDVRGPAEFAKLSRTYHFNDLIQRKLDKACYGVY